MNVTAKTAYKNPKTICVSVSVLNEELSSLLHRLLLATVFASIAAAQELSAPPISIRTSARSGQDYRGSQPSAKQFEDLKRLGVKDDIDLRKDRLTEAVGHGHAPPVSNTSTFL